MIAWYYMQGAQQVGPVGAAELVAAIQAGHVRAESLVWHAGLANWQPASQVPELAAHFGRVQQPWGAPPPAPAQVAMPPAMGSSPSAGAPELWNPNAAASWCLLFSPIFGAIVHAKNWTALGEPEKAKQSMTWAYAAMGAWALLLVNVVFSQFVPAMGCCSPLLGLGMLLGWYYGSARAQVMYVRQRFGEQYPRKSWGLPLAIAFGGWAANLVLVVVVLLLAIAVKQSG